MANVKFVLNRAGVAELMRSDEMMKILRDHADRAQASLGTGYEVTTHVGPSRANAMVSAETFAAKRENLKSNSILKAVFGS